MSLRDVEKPRSARPFRLVPVAEGLEGRQLLSTVSLGAGQQALDVRMPFEYAGPETKTVQVTVTRSAADGSAALGKRQSVNFDARFFSEPSASAKGRAAASRPIGPGVHKRITFQPGETTKTITVKLPKMPAGAESFNGVVGVRTSDRSFVSPYDTAYFSVFSNANKVPPTITSTQLTPQGFAITYSKPMNPASVVDVSTYDIQTSPEPPQIDTYYAEAPYPKSVELQSAVYDDATRTVTLIPAQPLDTTSYQLDLSGWSHIISSEFTDPRVDLQGNFLRYNNGLSSIPIGPTAWTAG